MNPTIKPLTERRAWNALAAHQQNVRKPHLRKLFADDPKRGERIRHVINIGIGGSAISTTSICRTWRKCGGAAV